MRVASIVPIAPFLNRTSVVDASSTVTRPVLRGLSGSGRCLMKVFRSPATSEISPTRNLARSIECAAMSPSAPEPAFCAAIVVADHVDHAGLLHGGQHALRLGDGVGERFLAEDGLARAGGGDRNLG